MNTVECEPVPTRVLNPNASEASYKPKQRSYRKTNLKKKVLAPDSPGAQMSGAETTTLKQRRRNVPDPYKKPLFHSPTKSLLASQEGKGTNLRSTRLHPLLPS